MISVESDYVESSQHDVLYIPEECSGCGLRNFKIWGTLLNGALKIEVRCMRCGQVNYSLRKGRREDVP